MAKYNIVNLNYLAVGPTRTLVNADIELGYQIYDRIHLLSAESMTSGYVSNDHDDLSALSFCDIGTEHGAGYFYPSEYIAKTTDEPFSTESSMTQVIMNEEQEYYIETDSNSRKYIRLFLSCCTEELKAKIAEFNNSRVMNNCTFLADHDTNDKNCLTSNAVSSSPVEARGLYDIRDVSIKKIGSKEQQNIVIQDTDKHHDIYVPDMKKMPVGFCQAGMQTDFENDAVVLSRPTTKKPYVFKSSDIDERNSKDQTVEYTMQLKNDNLKTYVYGMSSESNINPYAFFQPAVNFNGVEYSYMIDIPVGPKMSRDDMDTAKYDDGVTYFRRLIPTKSAFNSLYTMQMSSYNMLDECREYIEIKSCAGKPYLKYYDNLKYDGSISEQELKDSNTSLMDLDVEKRNSVDGTNSFQQVPYQKIEYIHPIDYSGNAKHKSNLYSIVISDSKIEDVESRLESGEIEDPDGRTAQALKMLKFEIMAAVRDIAEDVAPANTQLFDVKFQS